METEPSFKHIMSCGTGSRIYVAKGEIDGNPVYFFGVSGDDDFSQTAELVQRIKRIEKIRAIVKLYNLDNYSTITQIIEDAGIATGKLAEARTLIVEINKSMIYNEYLD